MRPDTQKINAILDAAHARGMEHAKPISPAVKAEQELEREKLLARLPKPEKKS